MLFTVIKCNPFRIDLPMAFHIIYHHLGALELVLEMGGVNPDKLIVFQSKFHLLLKNDHFIGRVQIEAYLSKAQHRGLVQKFRDE